MTSSMTATATTYRHTYLTSRLSGLVWAAKIADDGLLFGVFGPVGRQTVPAYPNGLPLADYDRDDDVLDGFTDAEGRVDRALYGVAGEDQA